MFYLLICISILSALVPVFVNFGKNFEYENTLLISVVSEFLFLLISLTVSKKNILNWKKYLRYKIIFIWSFVIIPILTIVVSCSLFFLFQCRCSFQGYFFWLLVNSYPCIVLGCLLFFLTIFLRNSASLIMVISFYIALFFMLAVQLLWQLWAYPQKRFCHLFLGFIHGPIYDEWIVTDWGIIWLRFGHLLFLFIGLTFIFNRRKQGIAAAILFSFVIFSAQKYSSFIYGKESLDKMFSVTKQENGFVVYAETEDQKLNIFLKEVRFHFNDLKKILQLKNIPTIYIYLYNNDLHKKLWFGSSGTDVTDIYTPSIHTTLGKILPHATIRHELVHAMLSKNAFYGLGFHPNMAFTEGLAVALAPTNEALSLDETAAEVVKDNAPDYLLEIANPMFFKEATQKTYTISGSFINFLIKNYSIHAVISIYNGASIISIFQKTLTDLAEEWIMYLKHVRKEKNAIFLKHFYQEPSLLNSTCPHSRVDLSFNGENDPLVFLKRPQNWNVKNDYQLWVSTLDHDKKSYKLSNLQKSLIGYANGNKKISLESFLKPFDFTVPNFVITLEDLDLLLIISDFYRFNEEKEQSLKILKKIDSLQKDHFMGPQILRAFKARWIFEHNYPDSISFTWRRYLAGVDKIPPKITDDTFLINYLNFRYGYFSQQHDLGWFLEKLKKLQAASIDAEFLEFKKEWQRLLSSYFYNTNQLSLTQGYFCKLENYQYTGNERFLGENCAVSFP